MLIFLFFGIIGIFYLIWQKKPNYNSVFGLFALLTIVLFVPTPIQTLWQTMILLNFARFQLLVLPFMALMMALGLFLVPKYFLSNKIYAKIFSFVIICLFLIYSASSVGLIQYKYKEIYPYRNSFNSDELIGFYFAQKNIPIDSFILSDTYTAKYLAYFSEENSQIIKNVDSLKNSSGYVIIPKKQFLNDGLLFTRGSELNRSGGEYSYLPTDENIHDLYWGLYSKNQIYSSESVEVFNN
jgi:hypothetical protein